MKLRKAFDELHGIRPSNEVLASCEKVVKGYSDQQLIGMVNDFNRNAVTSRPLFYEAIIAEVKQRAPRGGQQE